MVRPTLTDLIGDKFDIPDVAEFLVQYPHNYDAISHLISQPNYWKTGVPKTPFIREQFYLLIEKHGCAVPQKFEEASILELEIITKRSPFYAMDVFNVSFGECLQMAKMLKINISNEVLAYNVIFNQLKTQEQVTIAEGQSLLNEYGLLLADMPNLASVLPYGVGVLKKHPLEKIDPMQVPPAKMVHLVNNPGELIPRIRERNSLVNKLTMYNDAYVLNIPIDEFVDFIVSLME